jgi:hypothetical protein
MNDIDGLWRLAAGGWRLLTVAADTAAAQLWGRRVHQQRVAATTVPSLALQWA